MVVKIHYQFHYNAININLKCILHLWSCESKVKTIFSHSENLIWNITKTNGHKIYFPFCPYARKLRYYPYQKFLTLSKYNITLTNNLNHAPANKTRNRDFVRPSNLYLSLIFSFWIKGNSKGKTGIFFFS